MSSEAAAGYDPAYELTRVTDDAKFLRKLRIKRWLYRLVGEIYIGKRVKLAYFRRWLRRLPLPQRASVLEVGSGDGLFCFVAADMLPDAKVIGLELNPTEASGCEAIARAERRDNLRFLPGLIHQLPPDERHDLVFCLDVLEHIADDCAALVQMRQVMNDGGHLLIHVPNRHYQEADGTMHSVPDSEAWRINPGHVRSGYTPDELRAVIKRAGFEVLEIQPTQGRPIARAHRLYRRAERFLPARVAILPLIDRLTRHDLRHPPAHGNTVWAWAKKSPARETVPAVS